MASLWTVGAVLRTAQEHLSKKQVRSPRLEAELLLAHSLGASRVELYLQHDRPLSLEERDAFRGRLKERLGGKPLQYITGRQPFRHLDLMVEPGVFIPRPETELLVQAVIDQANRMPGPLRVLEMGTGSGAVGLSLAKELGDVKVWTVDISTTALRVAGRNALAHGLGDKVVFKQGDLFDALGPEAAGSFEILVANPPYIPSADIERLMPEVGRFEPREALDGGAGGLDFYRRIAERAPGYLTGDGFVAFEVGAGQAPAVKGLLEVEGFLSVAIQRDYNQIERIVTGRLAGSAAPAGTVRCTD
jgi:release factor glutamine methyltransferase